MPRRGHISVGLLLVVFAVGGVASPVVHRVLHGAEQIANRTEKSCHSPDVHHAAGPVWADAAAALRAPECVFCATRLLVVPPTPAPITAPRVVGARTVEEQSQVAAVHGATDCFIRGPPSL